MMILVAGIARIEYSKEKEVTGFADEVALF
jgi:hypothetical protein